MAEESDAIRSEEPIGSSANKDPPKAIDLARVQDKYEVQARELREQGLDKLADAAQKAGKDAVSEAQANQFIETMLEEPLAASLKEAIRFSNGEKPRDTLSLHPSDNELKKQGISFSPAHQRIFGKMLYEALGAEVPAPDAGTPVPDHEDMLQVDSATALPGISMRRVIDSANTSWTLFRPEAGPTPPPPAPPAPVGPPPAA